MKTKSNMTVKLDYKKMVKDIYKLVESDWLEDMECKWRLHDKPEEFTQKEAQKMIKILCQIFSISHCYFCTSCQGKYNLSIQSKEK